MQSTKTVPDIKEELDNAMRALEDADPFYTADLYKRYFSMDYTPILTGEEKAWLKKHGAIRMGFLTSDSGVSVYDPATGELTGAITDYIRFASRIVWAIRSWNSSWSVMTAKEAELDALKSGEIDMVFHFDQSPNLAEEYHFACTNTTWTSNLMAVTNKQHFNENQANRVAVPQNKILPDKVPCVLLSAVGDRGLRYTGGCGKAGQGRTGGLLCHRGQQRGKIQQEIRAFTAFRCPTLPDPALRSIAETAICCPY